jgi:hypothetical protein
MTPPLKCCFDNCRYYVSLVGGHYCTEETMTRGLPLIQIDEPEYPLCPHFKSADELTKD